MEDSLYQVSSLVKYRRNKKTKQKYWHSTDMTDARIVTLFGILCDKLKLMYHVDSRSSRHEPCFLPRVVQVFFIFLNNPMS